MAGAQNGRRNREAKVNDKKIQSAIHVAIILNLDKLPQMKGKGKPDRDKIEDDKRWFIEAVTEKLSCYVWMIGPPAPAYSTPPGKNGNG
jgi:hypothetical protein